MINDFYESTAERRARRNNDIKHLFQHLTINEGMSFMDAYEAVGYHFYLSAGQMSRAFRRHFESISKASATQLAKPSCRYPCQGPHEHDH